MDLVSGRLLAYAQLVRLPNVFTAFGDILMAACVVGAITADVGRVVLLLFASGSLYLGGMVWNDIFDRKDDAKTRPSRPLPSGRVSLKSAVMFGSFLFVVGIVFSIFARQTIKEFTFGDSILISIVLIVAIILYNAWLKRTPFGPIGMGFCRFLNVMLGLSAGAIQPTQELSLHIASVIGIYIVGVTWFARTEEGMSKPKHLLAASIVMYAGLILALAVPTHFPAGTITPFYPYLLTAFGFWIGIAIVQAIKQPNPINVQASVKRCILGLVLLDAILATAFIGLPGLLIGFLLLPARWLGKWVYST